jgi:molybdenum cofactor synthesis domain-containing protein
MGKPFNPTAVVIIIGNEILSGRTRDANLSFLGRRCDELGILLQEARVIKDDEATIINTVNVCRKQYDYVFTTGGIGPTHDDITTAAVARAFQVELERNAAAVAAMEKYYPPGMLNEARLKMADIPRGARLIDNPVSGAPGVQMENVFVFAGVPLIMQAMFDGITDRLTGGPPVLTQSVRTNLTEGVLAEGLARVQEGYANVSIGSYPYFRAGKLGVNLVMRSIDDSAVHDAAEKVRELIRSLDGSLLNADD